MAAASTCINYFVGMLVGESVALFGWNQYRCREILNSTRSIIAQNATGELYHATVNYNGTVQTINRLPDVTLRPNCHANFLLNGSYTVAQNDKAEEDFQAWSDSVCTAWTHETFWKTYKQHSMFAHLYRDVFRISK